MRLDLEGNAHPDVAGTLFRFRNPNPETPPADSPLRFLAPEQRGMAGDITGSRRVRGASIPPETLLAMTKEERQAIGVSTNCLYLEWIGEKNGRVVVEGPAFDVEILDIADWRPEADDIEAQALHTSGAIADFLSTCANALAPDEDVPAAEAAWDRETERMDLLTERISRRLEKEGTASPADWHRIYCEESARLRRERGEPEVDDSTWKDWIDDLDAAAEAAAEQDDNSEAWKGGDRFERQKHPLVLDCQELALSLRRSIIIPKSRNREHPLAEIADRVLFASGKLAGALNASFEDHEWPPDPIFAPSVLVFLKKARGYLQDAMLALDSADEENLATPEWRLSTRAAVERILDQTQTLIKEARAVLGEAPEG